MLTGQAKTDYQREYMRKRRSNEKAKQETNLLDLSDVAVLDPEINFVGGFHESIHDRLARTPLAELIAGDGFIPNWRMEQG